MTCFNEPPHLCYQSFQHLEWSIALRVSVTAARNTLSDGNNGGDDVDKKVAAVEQNSLGIEKLKPIQSTLFLSIEGS